MNFRPALLICLGAIVGATCAVVWNMYITSDASMVARNWQTVNDYTTIMRGDSPSHTKVNGTISITEYPVDPEPAFAFLVSKRELHFADLIFPTVANSRENNAIWMDFAREHYPDIFWATGHTNIGPFETTGAYPLHLNVWYKNTHRAQELVNELIRLLESSKGTRVGSPVEQNMKPGEYHY